MSNERVALALVGLLVLGGGAARADSDKAKQLAGTVCIACHGADGNSPAPTFPKLAGMQPEYLRKQLEEYISGKRASDVMAPVVAALDAEDLQPLAVYFGSQKPSAGKVQDRALADAGRVVYQDGNPDTGVPACMGCHQEDGSGNPRFPRLAGQHSEYTVQQMMQFKGGVRTNDRGRVMRSLAARMSDAEIKAVAEYISGM